MKVYILGVETSCDETAASVLEFGDGSAPRVLSNVVASQHEIHARFGGVVPELAARRHVEMISPVLKAALEDASISTKEVDAVAVTRGPGLVVALLVGLSAAKGLAWSLKIPLIGVHHLDGHIHSLFLPTGTRATLRLRFLIWVSWSRAGIRISTAWTDTPW